MEETHPSFLRTSTDLLIPVSKIISRPLGVGTTKGLLVSPSIGYNHRIFVCSHHFIYCWLKAIHFYRSYLSSGFRARCEMELVCSSRYPYFSWVNAHCEACVTWLWCTGLSLCFFFLGGGGASIRSALGLDQAVYPHFAHLFERSFFVTPMISP